MTTSFNDAVALESSVFKTLLLFASQEGTAELLSFEEALALEIVAGTVARLAGPDKAVLVPSFEQMRSSSQRLELTLNDIMEESVAKYGSALDPRLAATLVELTHFEFCTDHGERWYETPLRWKLTYWPVFNELRPTFALTVPFVEDARAAAHRLPADIREQCETVGIAMCPYVARDVAYIQKCYHYRW